VITDARTGASREMASREKQYVITMAFRMACFISIFFVHGWLRWVVLAGAVFLPFIAVLFANQADTKQVVSAVEHGEPSPAPQLTTGGELVGEVIEGELAEDEPVGQYRDGERRFPGGDGSAADDDDGWSRRERVA
jgi:hypothetical protein